MVASALPNHSPVITSKPHLWTAKLEAIVSLSNRFATGDLLDIPQSLDQGLHIILVDSETPETAVRAGIYQILSSGNTPAIYETRQPLEIFTADQSLSVGELSGQIVEFSQSYEQWLHQRSKSKLSLKDAVEIAKVVMAYEKEPQKSVELGTLRMRCDQSSYDWNKLMEKLEREFLQELQKRGITFENPTALVDTAKIQEEYIRLLENAADDAAIEKFKIKVREQYSGLQPSELNKLLEALTNQFQRQQAQEDEISEIAKLVDATEQTINLADYLPAKIANPLAQYSHWQNLRHAVVFTSFITAVSSLHKVGTELILQRSVGFKVPPTLFGAIVAESGSKKSPIFRATAREPLNVLKKDDAKEYELELKQYEAELKQWNESEKGKKGECPQEPPKPPLYYFSDATGEGIKAQAASAPDKALFALVDELAGFFNSSNQYRGGRGSDKQDLLSYFDGTGATVLRSGGVKVDVMQIYLSILGTIQPEILRQAMGNTNDFDGSWARFLIAIQPNTPSQLPDENHVGVDMKDLLATYFRAIHNLPKTEYRLSQDAFKLYQSWYNRLEQLRVSHPSSGMRAVYSKAEGLTGRLALNLHVLHELASDRTPSIEIPLARIKEAINLMKFYIGQIKLIHAFVDDSSPVPQVLKIIELSRRKQLGGEEGWIKAKDIQNATSKKQRLKANEVREWIIQAAKSGHGETRGEGIRLEFRAFMEEVGKSRSKSRSKVGYEPTDESLAISSFQEKVGFVGHSYNDSPTSQINQPTTDGLPDNQDLVGYEPIKPTNAENLDTATVVAVGQEPTFQTTVEPTFQSIQSELLGQPQDEPQNTATDTIDEALLNVSEFSVDTSIQDESATLPQPIITVDEQSTPSVVKADKPVSLSQVERDGGNIDDFIGHQVEVRSLGGDIKFVGTMVSRDSKNGIVSVETSQGNKTAYLHEAYLSLGT
ncbi:DUF3987 domain-containing protein [Anabaena sp. 4-3]|uniref:DUF3987 domain-containing protein n=1 Tax=Anabaena sp. 4-3 TaxID=1811979 RepID=UPI0008335825|nr:DUF3987 domain-containing protein [Anabaena sp. 4-3]